MKTIDIMDVTEIEPRLKHPSIFKKFDELEGGESFIIKNDHDPKPLYYQMLALRGNIFNWEYLMQGPIWWEVKISKFGKDEIKTVGEIVASDIRKAEIFRKYGIDFCCGGKKSLKEACEEKEVNIESLINELEVITVSQQNNAAHYNDWDLDFLVNYIIQNHHKYVLKAIPEISVYLDKVVSAHGDAHYELIEIQQEFTMLAKEMMQHMQKEEQVLFPYINELVNVSKNEGMLNQPHFGTILSPIAIMEKEHELAGNLMADIKELSSNFKAPEDACASYKYLYDQLSQFEEDLHMHVHLENNILFPRAIELEEQLNDTYINE